MAGLLTPITVTGSLTPETALVKNADGSTITNPTFADCVYDASRGEWLCKAEAPASTTVYPVGAQLFRLKGSNPPIVAYSKNTASVSGGTPTAQPLVFTPRSTEFAFNKRDDTASVDQDYGLTYRDALAAWGLTTDTTSLLVRGKNSYDDSNGSGAFLSVYVGASPRTATLFQKLDFTQVFTEQQFSVSGLPAGSKTVWIFESTPYRANEQGKVKVVNLTGVTVPGAYTATVASPAGASEAVVVLGNSRSVGGHNTDATRYCWTRQLGRRRGADVFLLGYSSLRLSEHILTNAQRQQVVAEYTARTAGYAKKVFVLADTENDWANNSASPAQLAAGVQALLPLLYAVDNTAQLLVQTQLPDQDNSNAANAGGYTRANYDAALTAAVQQAAYARLVTATAIGVTASDYGDNQHLNDSGDTKVAVYYDNFITNGGAQPVPTTSVADYALTGVIVNASNQVTGWNDSSANKATIDNTSITNTSLRPVKNAAGDITFNGNQYMQGVLVPQLAGSAGVTVFLVMNSDGSDASTFVLSLGSGQQFVSLGVLSGGDGVQRFGLNTYTGALSGTVNPLTKLAAKTVVSANIRPNSPNNFQLWFNGVLQEDASTVTTGNNNTAQDNHAVRRLDGYVYVGGNAVALNHRGVLDDVRIRPLLSDADRQAMENSLRSLYGI